MITVEAAKREDFEEGGLEDRMKFYENKCRLFLKPHIGESLIMRFDGRSFKSFTSTFNKPFDPDITESMLNAALAVCQELPKAFCAYTQSDEITIICHPKENDIEEIPFKGNVQKLCSVFASTVSTAFNMSMLQFRLKDNVNLKYYKNDLPKMAQFDARVWLLPKEELINSIIWRQQDCERNSVSMLAQDLYSHKMLQNKNREQMITMIDKTGQSWQHLPINLQRGSFIFKEDYTKTGPKGELTTRTRWVVDTNMPKISSDRNYFLKLLKS